MLSTIGYSIISSINKPKLEDSDKVILNSILSTVSKDRKYDECTNKIAKIIFKVLIDSNDDKYSVALVLNYINASNISQVDKSNIFRRLLFKFGCLSNTVGSFIR
jgi:hypothetical protein